MIDELVAFLVIGFGLVYVAVGSALLDRPRRWLHARLPAGLRRLLECAPCSAFWAGAGLGAAGFTPHELLEPLWWLELPWRLDAAIVGALLLIGAVAAYQGATGWIVATLGREAASREDR